AGGAGEYRGGGAGPGHLAAAHDFLHAFGAAHEIAEAACFSELALENRQLPRVADLAQSAVQQRAQHRALERLLDIPEGSGLDSGDGALLASFSGDDDGGNTLQIRTQLFQQVEAVHSREFDVGDERVRLIAGEFRKNLLRGGYSKNVITPALQELLVALARVVLVFDDEHAVFAFERFDGPDGRTRFFPHGSQPLLGFLSVKLLFGCFCWTLRM